MPTCVLYVLYVACSRLGLRNFSYAPLILFELEIMLEEAIDADLVISPLDLSRKELHLAPGAPECHLLPLGWFSVILRSQTFFFFSRGKAK